MAGPCQTIVSRAGSSSRQTHIIPRPTASVTCVRSFGWYSSRVAVWRLKTAGQSLNSPASSERVQRTEPLPSSMTRRPKLTPASCSRTMSTPNDRRKAPLIALARIWWEGFCLSVASRLLLTADDARTMPSRRCQTPQDSIARARPPRRAQVHWRLGTSSPGLSRLACRASDTPAAAHRNERPTSRAARSQPSASAQAETARVGMRIARSEWRAVDA
jgi:hypothetical protein